MKNVKMSTILVLRSELLRRVALVLALCLMVLQASVAEGTQSLTVNGQNVTSITLELGQSRTVEVVSTDNVSYVDYAGFDNGVVLGSFSHLETKPEAGNFAVVAEYNQPAFYGYYVNATGIAPAPSAGVHFVFEYVAQELGKTSVKLYDSTFKSLIDSVQITVIPLQPVAIGTAFTYQGRLLDVNSPADGLYDLQFKLYDNLGPFAAQQGSTIDINELDVIDGYFTVDLDFGSDVFAGDARWLEIGVRPGDSNNVFVTLSPWQEVTPTPYALYAESAGGDNDWTVSGNNMYSIPSGNVGIGTMSPGAKLDVAGNIAVNGTVDGVDLSAHAASANSHHTPPTALPPLGPAGGDLSGTYPNPTVVNDSHTHGDGTVTDGISINNGRLYAPTGTGNVGIGTTNPSEKLDVEGNIDVSSNQIKNYYGFPRPNYDSGWVSIAAGSFVTLPHNLGGNVDNYVVNMHFKGSLGIHCYGYGHDEYFISTQTFHSGAYYRDLKTDTIRVYRWSDDQYIDKVRIRIWVYN